MVHPFHSWLVLLYADDANLCLKKSKAVLYVTKALDIDIVTLSDSVSTKEETSSYYRAGTAQKIPRRRVQFVASLSAKGHIWKGTDWVPSRSRSLEPLVDISGSLLFLFRVLRLSVLHVII